MVKNVQDWKESKLSKNARKEHKNSVFPTEVIIPIQETRQDVYLPMTVEALFISIQQEVPLAQIRSMLKSAKVSIWSTDVPKSR